MQGESEPFDVDSVGVTLGGSISGSSGIHHGGGAGAVIGRGSSIDPLGVPTEWAHSADAKITP